LGEKFAASRAVRRAGRLALYGVTTNLPPIGAPERLREVPLFGRGRGHEEITGRGGAGVVDAMRGTDFTPPEGFLERLKGEGRVIIRLTADRVSGVTNRG